jgi:hypothetical protein
MEKRKFDIKFAAREYESQGKKKTYWTTHGTLFVNEAGRMSVKMDSIPQGKIYDGWFQCFEHEKFNEEF